MVHRGHVLDGDLVDGDLVDGDLVDGDVVDRYVVDRYVVDGDLVDGDLVDGDLLDGDLLDRDLLDRDLVDGHVVDGRVRRFVTARLGAVALLNVGLAGLLATAVNGDRGAVLVPTVVAAVAFTAAGMVRLELEHRGGRITVTPSHAVLVAAFGAVPAAGILAAATIGEVASLTLRGVDRFKVLYNGASRALAAAAGAAAYDLLAAEPGVGAWPAALAGAAVFTMTNLLATSTAIGFVEGRRLRGIVARATPTTMLAAGIAAPLGLVVVELWDRSPLAPLVLAPLVLAVWANAGEAAAGRREHELVARLYAASRDMGRLRAPDEQATVVASHAAELLVATGSACLWREHGGDWHTVATGDLAGAARHQLADQLGAVRDESVVDLGNGEVLLVARADDPPIDVLLVVRRLAPDGRSHTSELKTLHALASRGAAALQNSALLAEVERALVRQQDLARGKSEFIATVSHELRTPLAAMSGFVDTVLRLSDRLGPERSEEFLQRALEQGGRLGRLIDDLLAVAAADHARLPVTIETVPVASLVEDVQRTTSATAGGRLKVLVDDRAPGAVRTDADKAARIVVNLVDNAAKYSAGEIRLLVRRGPTGCVDLVVEDDGPGIPEGSRDRIFEPFVQLDGSATRQQGGIGLGLHLARRLAESVSGELSVGSSDSGGARFTLRLPEDVVVPTATDQPPPADVVETIDEAANTARPHSLVGGRNEEDW